MTCEYCGKDCENCTAGAVQRTVIDIGKSIIGIIVVIGILSASCISPHIMFKDSFHVITSDPKFRDHIKEYSDNNDIEGAYLLLYGNSIFDDSLEGGNIDEQTNNEN